MSWFCVEERDNTLFGRSQRRFLFQNKYPVHIPGGIEGVSKINMKKFIIFYESISIRFYDKFLTSKFFSNDIKYQEFYFV